MRNKHTLVLRNQSRTHTTIHRIFYYLTICRLAQKYSNTWIFITTFYISIKSLKIKFKLTKICRFEFFTFQLHRNKTTQSTMVKQ